MINIPKVQYHFENVISCYFIMHTVHKRLEVNACREGLKVVERKECLIFVSLM
jgi:hypothetical protein